MLGLGNQALMLRSDNGLVINSQNFTAQVKNYGLQQKFITPYSPEQNGMAERVKSTLNGQCARLHSFESLQHDSLVVGDWIGS